MLSNHPHTAVFLGSAIKNNAQPNKAEHYLSVCAQLYSSIWGASVGLNIGSGDLNSLKFDIANPDKITKIAKSYSLRQEFKCIYMHSFHLYMF